MSIRGPGIGSTWGGAGPSRLAVGAGLAIAPSLRHPVGCFCFQLVRLLSTKNYYLFLVCLHTTNPRHPDQTHDSLPSPGLSSSQR